MIYRKKSSLNLNPESFIQNKDRTVNSSPVRMSFGHLLDCFTGEFIITHAQWNGRFAYSLVIGRLNIFSIWFTIFYCDRLHIFCDIEYQSNKTEWKKNEPKRQFRDVTLSSVVANWASFSSILGAQPDFYSLWASGRPLICIPAMGRLNFIYCNASRIN